jgi:carboxymethylenebutenolidase
MCFDHDSSPPIPRIAGAAVSHDDLVLQAADGNRFAAFLATPDAATPKGVVVLPDVRGLYRFYEELALRFAERDYAALAIDYFGRTAGASKRGEEFDYAPHVDATTTQGFETDIAAAAAELRDRGCESIFTVGFCMGGRVSWLAAGAGLGLAGAVGFYGRPGAGRDGSAGPIDRVDRMECPVLALQAGADAHITAEDNAAFDRALTDAGVEHEVVSYDGAPHSFFDRKQEEFQAASDDAWQRVLTFLQTHG